MFLFTDKSKTNPAYSRHWITRQMRIVAPIPWRNFGFFIHSRLAQIRVFHRKVVPKTQKSWNAKKLNCGIAGQNLRYSLWPAVFSTSKSGCFAMAGRHTYTNIATLLLNQPNGRMQWKWKHRNKIIDDSFLETLRSRSGSTTKLSHYT